MLFPKTFRQLIQASSVRLLKLYSSVIALLITTRVLVLLLFWKYVVSIFSWTVSGWVGMMLYFHYWRKHKNVEKYRVNILSNERDVCGRNDVLLFPIFKNQRLPTLWLQLTVPGWVGWGWGCRVGVDPLTITLPRGWHHGVINRARHPLAIFRPIYPWWENEHSTGSWMRKFTVFPSRWHYKSAAVRGWDEGSEKGQRSMSVTVPRKY